MKIFLINLDKNPGRLARCDVQLKRLGVEYERFPGIYGRELSPAEKGRSVNRFLWWCHAGRRVTDGEIGCALSHLAIYRKTIADGLQCVCVLEDDVILDGMFMGQLDRVEKWIDPGKPQVVLLANHTKRDGVPGEFREELEGSFAEGYVITRAGAEAILKRNFPLRVAADSWAWFRVHCGVQLYHAFPSVCTQDWSDGSVTDVFVGGGRPGRCRGGICEIGYIVGRALGMAIDWLVR